MDCGISGAGFRPENAGLSRLFRKKAVPVRNMGEQEVRYGRF